MPFDQESMLIFAYVQHGVAAIGATYPEIQIRDRETGQLVMTPDALPFDGYKDLLPEHYAIQVRRVYLRRSWSFEREDVHS